MLTIRATVPGSLSLAVGVYVPELSSSALASYVSTYDPILRVLHGGNFYLPDQRVSIDSIFGWTPRPRPEVRAVYSRRPVTTSYQDPANLDYDDHTYGHPVNPGLVFLNILRGMSLSGGAPRGLVSREHFTRHRNLSGQLDLRSSSFLDDHTTVDFGSGKTMLVRSASASRYLLKGINEASSTYELGTPVPNVIQDIRPFFNFLVGGVWTFDYTWNFPGLTSVTGHVSDFSYAYGNLGLTFSWNFSMHQVAGDEHTVSWTVKVVIPGVQLPAPRFGSTDFVVLQGSASNGVFFSNCLVQGPPGDPGAGTRPDFVEYGGISQYIITSEPLADAFTSLASEDLSLPFAKYTGLDHVGLKVNDLWWDITALAGDTSVAAFNDLVSSYQDDEIKKVLAGMGVVGQLGLKLQQLNIKPSTFTTAYQTIKQMAGNVRLPQYRLALSALADLERLLADYVGRSDLGGYRIFMGRALRSYDLSSHFGRDVHLTLHTRATLWSSPSGLAEGLLGSDAVGFYLDFVKSWRSFPFQNFLNGALGVNAAISNFRAQVFSSTIPMWFVHTYKFVSPFTEDELNGWRAVDTSDEDSGLVVFHRDVSTYLPIPRPSIQTDSEYSLADLFRVRDLFLTKVLGQVLRD